MLEDKSGVMFSLWGLFLTFSAFLFGGGGGGGEGWGGSDRNEMDGQFKKDQHQREVCCPKCQYLSGDI